LKVPCAVTPVSLNRSIPIEPKSNIVTHSTGSQTMATNECSCRKVGIETWDIVFSRIVIGLESLISFVENSVSSGQDLRSFVSPLLDRIEILECMLSHSMFFT
jgi:hypothetical protein